MLLIDVLTLRLVLKLDNRENAGLRSFSLSPNGRFLSVTAADGAAELINLSQAFAAFPAVCFVCLRPWISHTPLAQAKRSTGKMKGGRALKATTVEKGASLPLSSSLSRFSVRGPVSSGALPLAEVQARGGSEGPRQRITAAEVVAAGGDQPLFKLVQLDPKCVLFTRCIANDCCVCWLAEAALSAALSCGRCWQTSVPSQRNTGCCVGASCCGCPRTSRPTQTWSVTHDAVVDG